MKLFHERSARVFSRTFHVWIKVSAPVGDPFQLALRWWQAALSMSMSREVGSNVSRLPRRITIATACSGSDVIIHVARSLLSSWHELYGDCHELAPQFSCEKDAEKQAFLKSQFPGSVIVGELDELGAGTGRARMKNGKTLESVNP
eukprot:6490412-Amphidinium_carterae.2